MVSILFILLFANDRIKAIIDSLLFAYPQIDRIENNLLYFKDGSFLVFDDKKEKSTQEALNDSDIEDMFRVVYDKKIIAPKNSDLEAGRFRNELFFKKIYGSIKEEIEKNLETITWFDGTKIRVTRINGISKKLQEISDEISRLPEQKKAIAKSLAGGYFYRNIRGTDRLSMHSFGIAIDLNLKNGEYWLNDTTNGHFGCCKKEIPIEIVEIFEKHGFIWGGRWHSYDTIHFEYRPELIYFSQKR